MAEITVTGTLPVGIMVAGKVHREYELRAEVLGDTMEAEEAGYGGDGLSVTRSAFVLARRLRKLGGLKPDEITMNLLRELDPQDYHELVAKAQAALSRKVKSFRTEKGAGGGEGGAGAA